MDEISPEFVERYQILLEKDPKSKVFAPLAEAYRKMGLQTRAFTICKSGLKFHPHFAGGHIAMAKVLVDLKETQKALEHLEKATEISPENIMAHQLHGELLLHLKQFKAALKAYKMVLFLSPENKKAMQAVKKLESLTADDFEKDLFPDEFGFSKPNHPSTTLNPTNMKSENLSVAETHRLDRFLSLIDVYIVRNELDKAKKIFEEARFEFAQHPELLKRKEILIPLSTSDLPQSTSIQILNLKGPKRKQELLNNFLNRINKYGKDKNLD